MTIDLPAIPAGVLTLLAFFAPYAIAALNGALTFVKKSWQKKLVSVIVALILAIVVIVFYQNITGEPIGNPWVFALIAIAVVAASHALITRDLGAKQIEAATSTTTPPAATELPTITQSQANGALVGTLYPDENGSLYRVVADE